MNLPSFPIVTLNGNRITKPFKPLTKNNLDKRLKTDMNEENYVKMVSQDEIAQIEETINHIIKDMTFLTNVVVTLQNQINVLEQRINRCYN